MNSTPRSIAHYPILILSSSIQMYPESGIQSLAFHWKHMDSCSLTIVRRGRPSSSVVGWIKLYPQTQNQTPRFFVTTTRRRTHSLRTHSLLQMIQNNFIHILMVLWFLLSILHWAFPSLHFCRSHIPDDFCHCS